MKWNKAYLLPVLSLPLLIILAACGNGSDASPGTETSGDAATTAPATGQITRPTLPADGTMPEDRIPPTIDWATAAAKLGINEEELRQAFENAGQRMPDMAAIAEKLGVSEDALREVLGFGQDRPGFNPDGGPNDGNFQPGDFPPPTVPSIESNTETY